MKEEVDVEELLVEELLVNVEVTEELAELFPPIKKNAPIEARTITMTTTEIRIILEIAKREDFCNFEIKPHLPTFKLREIINIKWTTRQTKNISVFAILDTLTR